MWSSITLEAVNIQNFNFGFSTYKSDILVHLSQWQLWWWMWFSLVWSLYFWIILTVVRKRTLQFNPIINTSIRGHGKWGDFLVAIIPLSWCGNILINSNFILRMIEWQNESSLFTIRVQGKQWYWVYKYDASAAQSILAAPKNIGRNKWFISTPLESYCADTYYQALKLGTQLEFTQLYQKLLDDAQKGKNTLNVNSLPVQHIKINGNKDIKSIDDYGKRNKLIISYNSAAGDEPKYNYYKRLRLRIARFIRGNFINRSKTIKNKSYPITLKKKLFARNINDLKKQIVKLSMASKRDNRERMKTYLRLNMARETLESKLKERTKLTYSNFGYKKRAKLHLKLRLKLKYFKLSLIKRLHKNRDKNMISGVSKVARMPMYKNRLSKGIRRIKFYLATKLKWYKLQSRLPKHNIVRSHVEGVKLSDRIKGNSLYRRLIKLKGELLAKFKFKRLKASLTKIENRIKIRNRLKKIYINIIKYRLGKEKLRRKVLGYGISNKIKFNRFSRKKFVRISKAFIREDYKGRVWRRRYARKSYLLALLNNYKNVYNSTEKFKKSSNNMGHHQYEIVEDTQDFSSNIIENVATRSLVVNKGILNEHILNLIKTKRKYKMKKLFLFSVNFSDNADDVIEKQKSEELLWGFKQKKYKRLQKYYFTSGATYDPKTFEVVSSNKPKNSPLILKSQLVGNFKELEFGDQPDNFNYHRALKYNRHRSELVPVTLARRLLRTKRTLVLPAHTNITVITNSYDVVHSWFIPGLGIKLDCVPGRSTHHTFYIDNVGFYYGQCAEICGRYHHHMPIRICALPFNHFLVWWQTKGLKRLHRVKTIKNNVGLDSNEIKFRYAW